MNKTFTIEMTNDQRDEIYEAFPELEKIKWYNGQWDHALICQPLPDRCKFKIAKWPAELLAKVKIVVEKHFEQEAEK